METKIQIFYEGANTESTLTSYITNPLLSGCNGQKNLKDDDLKIMSDLVFENNKGADELDLFHPKNNLLSRLKQINISSCKLTETPNMILKLKYLTELDLSNNFLENLPNEIGNLHNLITLKLPGNKLQRLPKSMQHIQQLNYLDLSSNKFTEVPDVLYSSLRVLRVLNFSDNLLTQFNEPPACLSRLIILRLSNNTLNQLPLWIFDNLCQLQVLDVSDNQLRLGVELVNPCTTGIFDSLQVLNIENCNFSCNNIQVFSYSKQLKVLHLGNKKNSIEKFKKNYFGNLKVDTFRNFIEIKDLYLQNVEIGTLPSDFNFFRNIQLLDLSDNKLSWLPESFCNLTTLKVLNLTSNQLLFLPNNIGNLINLQQIHLSNNKLYQIPESFYGLINLQFSDFYNNQIEKINFGFFKEKNLKGVDLGCNCLQFHFNECDGDEVEMLYNCLKNSFRKNFYCMDSRSDLQKNSADAERSTESYSSSRDSICSFNSEGNSDLDDFCVNTPQKNHIEDENWESEDLCADEDEMFDPNEPNPCQPLRKSWTLDLQNNFCPAKFSMPSVMKTFRKNLKMNRASQNEPAEGQFDSD